MNMNETPTLLHNETATENHWLSLKLVGTKSNRSAIGASVTLIAGGRPQRQDVLSQSSFYSQNDLRLHFGLGQARLADSVEIRWPSGTVQQVRAIQADQIVTIRERN